VPSGKLRWGVLSTANIGRVAVCPAIQASHNGRLVAVASRDAERAREYAREADIPRHHASYEALLDDEGVDAVYIPLPNAMHRVWTIRAAERGKHVLCEKPLAPTAAECREMADAARSAGVLLMEAFMYRFHPRTEAVLGAVRAGDVGEVRSVRSTFTFRLRRENDVRLDPELGGGALLDVGCYCVNASRTLAGAEPVEVQALATWTERGVDAELAGMLRFDSGLVAHFDCALTLERREHLEIGGTEGTLVVPFAFLPGTGDATWNEMRGRQGDVERRVPGADEYRLMVAHFAEAALSGAAVRYGPDEAERNMRAIEALYASARDGGRPKPMAG
jgi:predicted dehydrogenase